MMQHVGKKSVSVYVTCLEHDSMLFLLRELTAFKNICLASCFPKKVPVKMQTVNVQMKTKKLTVAQHLCLCGF